MGRRFIIQTDQWSLKYLLEKRITTPEQHKRVAKLLGYNYEIQYRPGRENSAADALSRRPDDPTLNNLFMPQLDIYEEIKQAATGDDYMVVVSNLTQTHPEGPFTQRNGLILFKGRIVVPSNVTLHSKLIYMKPVIWK